MSKISALMVLCGLGMLHAQFSTSNIGFGVDRRSKRYYLSELKANWWQAFQFCRSRDMFLVSIHHSGEREDVINFLASTGFGKANKDFKLWTSGADLAEEGTFHWMSTGHQLKYNDNWRDGEPNNYKHDYCTREDCMVLEFIEGAGRNYNYTFDDRPCSRQFAFICENLSN